MVNNKIISHVSHLILYKINSISQTNSSCCNCDKNGDLHITTGYQPGWSENTRKIDYILICTNTADTIIAFLYNNISVQSKPFTPDAFLKRRVIC